MRLKVRICGKRSPTFAPVLCLPGLTRNSSDFHELACHLAYHAKRPRQVIAIDARGRGYSEHDPDWRNYTLVTEAADVVDVLAAVEVPHAFVVGTSRGGQVAMLLAALRPSLLQGVVLNDIGPETDGRGIARIRATLNATRAPANWNDAAELLRRAHETSFPNRSADDWMDFARRTYFDDGGKPVPAYDTRLLKLLDRIDLDSPLPTMWPQFDALADMPLMVLRGALSDILSPRTAENMRARRPDLEYAEVADAGHTPDLADSALRERISAFIQRAETRRP